MVGRTVGVQAVRPPRSGERQKHRHRSEPPQGAVREAAVDKFSGYNNRISDKLGYCPEPLRDILNRFSFSSYPWDPNPRRVAMPTLRIMSIYKEHKRTFATELDKARTERDQFTATLVARFGKEAADAMRRNAWWTEEVILGQRKMSREISIAAKRLRSLDRKVVAIRKRIRTPDCWFRECPGPVSMLEMVGLSWGMVHKKCAQGRLPISAALWLLKVLRTAEQKLPTEGQAWEGAATRLGPCRLSEKWQRLLSRRRRRLALLLDTAVMLEEDVRWQFRL